MKTEAQPAESFFVETEDVRLELLDDGIELVFKSNNKRHCVARVSSAFPLTTPGRLVSFFDKSGAEVCILRNAGELDKESLQILQEELEKCYFMPTIRAIEEMQERLGVETWRVRTNKGERAFEVRDPRRNVRQIGGGQIVIKDVDANRYLIPNWKGLDRKSIKLLMRHL